MKKLAVLVVSLVFMIGMGAAGIPLIQYMDNGFSDIQQSDSFIQTGKVDLQVDFETERNGSTVLTGDWGERHATFEEENITWNSSGSTLLDIDLQSNPSWIWFKVNQTKNIEGSNVEEQDEGPELLGYWSLNGSSGPVNDVEGNDGSNNGATRNADGKFGKAFRFDGKDDYVEIPHRSSYETGDGTVSVWFKMNDSSSNWILTKDENGCDGDCGHMSIAYDSFIAEDNLGVRVQNDGNGMYYNLSANKSKETIEPGEWNHAAFTFGKYGMKLYVNGELHDENLNTEGITVNELPINIGRKYNGQNHFNGTIDEPRIYGEALSETEIQQLYNSNDITNPDTSDQFKQCSVSIESITSDDDPVDAKSITDLNVEVKNSGEPSEVRVNLFTDGKQGETEVRKMEAGETKVFDFSMMAGDDKNRDGTIEMNVTAGQDCKDGDQETKDFSVDYSGDPAVARVNITPENPEAGEEIKFELVTEKNIEDHRWEFWNEPDSDDKWWESVNNKETSSAETVTRTYDNPGYYPYIMRIERQDGTKQPYSAHVNIRPETQEPVCPDDTPEEGELGDHLRFQVWYDDGDGTYDPGTEEIIFNGTAHQFGNFADYSGPGLGEGGLLDGDFQDGSDYDQQPFQPGTHHLGIRWNLPKDAPCQVAGDEKWFDFKLEAEQRRNNPDPGTSWDKGFGDTEESLDNYFKAGELKTDELKKTPQETEEPPENICGPVLGPESSVQIERNVDGQTEQHQYNTEIDPQQTNNTVRFEYESGGDQLGDSDEVESELFTVDVDGDPGEVVYIKTKSGKLIGTAVLNGEGDITSGTSGKYSFELIEVNDLGGSTEYKIKVTTSGESGSEIKELSHIDFSFCQPIKNHAYYQLDLTTEQLHVPHQSEADHDLVLSAINKTEEGDIVNPDVDRTESGLEIIDREFKIKDGEATVEFEVTEGSKEIGLTAYELPGPYEGWTDPEANQQKLHDYAFGEYGTGTHEISVDLPGGLYPTVEELRKQRNSTSNAETVLNKTGPYSFNGDNNETFQHESDMELENGSLSFSFEMDDESENWMFTKDEDYCTADCGHLSVAYKSSFINNDGLGVRLQNNGGSGSGAVLKPRSEVEAGEKYNLTVTWGEEGTKLYLNGKLHAVSSKTKGIEHNQLSIILGQHYEGENGKGMEGSISELKIFNKQLNSDQVRQMSGDNK